MNLHADVFGGSKPVLPHVTWPIVPYEDESLAGFTARTCTHNGLWNPSVLITDAGLHLPKGVGHLPRVSRDLSDLATLLAADWQWVENRRHRTAGECSGRKALSVDFHGATLRRAHFNYVSQRVAPTAIRERPYHREIWHVHTLAACGITGEVLVDACSHLGCDKRLGWGGPKGIGHCTDSQCEGTISSLTSVTVPKAQRAGLSLAAALINPSADDNATALAALPACVRQENRGDLFELAWLLGCLNDPKGPTIVLSPARLSALPRCELLARGADRLMNWPHCLTTVLRRSAELGEAATDMKQVVQTLRAIVRKPTTVGRPAALFAAELEGISSSAFSAVIGQRLGLLTATAFARAAGLNMSKMAVLQRSTHLPRLLFSEGGRDIALFSPGDASDIRRRIEDRLPAQVFGSGVGLGIDAVEMLLDDNVLLLADDQMIQLLWDEPHLDSLVATDFRELLTSRLRQDQAPDNAIRLSVALYGCAAGDKPWPAIIDAVIAGRLSLHRGDEKRLDVRSYLISPQDVRKVRALSVLEPYRTIRSEWLSEADASERLSTSGRRLRSLSKANRLATSGSFSGLTYRRSEIDAIAGQWVSTLELQAKLDQSRRRDLSSTLRAVGLTADEHGLVPRDAAREKLGLLLV